MLIFVEWLTIRFDIIILFDYLTMYLSWVLLLLLLLFKLYINTNFSCLWLKKRSIGYRKYYSSNIINCKESKNNYFQGL